MSVFRVVEPFAYTAPDGSARVMRPGDLVADDDPCMKGRSSFFEPVEATVRRVEQIASSLADLGNTSGVEQATAAPGEKRAAKLVKGPKED